MFLELHRHRIAYATLFIVLLLFVLIFMGVWPNRLFQQISIVVMMIFYVVWGCITHVKTATLTRRVAGEYIGVALLSGGLLLLITI